MNMHDMFKLTPAELEERFMIRKVELRHELSAGAIGANPYAVGGHVWVNVDGCMTYIELRLDGRYYAGDGTMAGVELIEGRQLWTSLISAIGDL